MDLELLMMRQVRLSDCRVLLSTPLNLPANRIFCRKSTPAFRPFSILYRSSVHRTQETREFSFLSVPPLGAFDESGIIQPTNSACLASTLEAEHQHNQSSWVASINTAFCFPVSKPPTLEVPLSDTRKFPLLSKTESQLKDQLFKTNT